MKEAIVITSIFPPTQAIIEFAKKLDFQVCVVGDIKWPKDWYCEGVRYISISEQQSLPYELTRLLPFNHYGRKMVGFLQQLKKVQL